MVRVVRCAGAAGGDPGCGFPVADLLTLLHLQKTIVSFRRATSTFHHGGVASSKASRVCRARSGFAGWAAAIRWSGTSKPKEPPTWMTSEAYAALPERPGPVSG